MNGPILCVDFDGTLVAEDGSIHPDDVAALRSGASGRVVAATGRPLHSVRAVLAPYGLDAADAFGFGMVLENGAALYGPGAELELTRVFADSARVALLEAMAGAPEITFLVFAADTVSALHPSEAGDSMAARFHLDVAAWTGPPERITKVVSVAASPDPLRAFDAAVDVPSERAFSLATVLEFQAPGVDKASGLDALLARRDAGGPVIVAGDGENDLPLFSRADVVVVPVDAPEAIRARADLLVDVGERGILRPMLDAAPR